MAGRGSFGAITTDEMKRLLAEPYDERPYYAHEMPVAFDEYMDKAWVAIHRALSDGTLYGALGEPPLADAVLGEELIGVNNIESFLYLKRPTLVVEIAAELAGLTAEQFQEKLDVMGDVNKDPDAVAMGLNVIPIECEYVWPYFEAMREFYRRAAAEGLAVLFGWG